jgi:uncharacterized protein (DUF1697 family)
MKAFLEVPLTTFVALLRGINVGGNKTIRMGALKALFEAHGLSPARTLLNSGNVIFASRERDRAKLGESIEETIEAEFGFRPAVVLRSTAELRRIVADNPFPAMAKADPGHLVAMLLAGKPQKDAAKRIANAYSGPEEVRIAGEDAYITYPKGIGRSKLTNALLEKQLGVAGTARNWNTVTKLLELAETFQP